MPVFFVAGPAAFGGKIILIPPLELILWRQQHPAGFLAADEISAHRHHGFAALASICFSEANEVRVPRMEEEFDQPDTLNGFRFDVLDARDVEEVILVVRDDEALV